MNEGYNTIQYAVPENSEIVFSILSETRNVSLILLDGVADIHIKEKKTRLPLHQEYPLPIWECLWPRLKTKTDCNFLVRGNHYIFLSEHKGLVNSALFNVYPIDNSYSFVLEKDIQLQIFPTEYAEQEPPVKIKSSRGAPEISGYKLSTKTMYSLSPFSPILLKSSDGEPYSVFVKGLDRKVKLSILDGNNHTRMNAVKEHIFSQCLFGKKFKNKSPTILVLGPKNVGKSSFCQLLVNEALDKRMTPVYVDLNVKRNLYLPGSLSLTEIEDRVESTLGFRYDTQRLLHYGSVIFHSINLDLYNYLVKKMAGLLTFHQKYSDKKYSLSIIDTDGSQGEDDKSIEFILNSFTADLVVFIGDQHFFENLKQSVLKMVPSEFIPKPCNIELYNDNYESKYYQARIQKYFSSSIRKPFLRNVRTVRIDSFTIYRILSTPNEDKTDDYKIESMACNQNMLNRLLAVSAAKRVELHSLTEVKYYVCFTAIDMAAKTVTVMAPEFETFNGGILLMGYILKMKDSDSNA